jgi:lipopolysaccharide/colanic/teichoic acid biosynthesis glycosyltransferase
VIKVTQPQFDKKPSGGLVFKMPRISKGGKIIGVYKIRTMHPYSEYLQDYVVKMNGYNIVGKPNKDFRLTHWGKILRKLHLDELPQLLNVLKGELNIVGVRPISQFGFKALPADLQKDRIKYKPGCIPPNVSLGKTGFDGVIAAERQYLTERRKHGSIIHIKYFWMAMRNLLRRKNTSS